MTRFYFTDYWDEDIILDKDIEKYSIAAWQPKKFNFPTLEIFQPILDGKPIQHVPPREYIFLYAQVLKKNYGDIAQWFFHQKKDVALLCWCNKSRQKKFPNVMCHTILAGWTLEDINHSLFNEFIYRSGRNADWFGSVHRESEFGWETIENILEGRY